MPRTAMQELRIVKIVALWQSEGKRKKEKGKNRDCDHASYHLESSSFFLPLTFLLILLRRIGVTRRWLLLSHIRSVAIRAATGLFKSRELVGDCPYLFP